MAWGTCCVKGSARSLSVLFFSFIFLGIGIGSIRKGIVWLRGGIKGRELLVGGCLSCILSDFLFSCMAYLALSCYVLHFVFFLSYIFRFGLYAWIMVD